MKYLKILWSYFKIGFNHHIYYRSGFFFDFVGRLMMIMFIILLWITVYKQAPTVGGLSLSEIIVYYIFAFMVRIIANPNISTTISDHIKIGRIQTLMIRPFHPLLFYFGWIFAKRLGEAVLFLLATTVTLIFIFPNFNITIGDLNILNFLVMLIIAVLISFLSGALVGMSSFWIVEATPVAMGFNSLASILGGLLVPLSFFPSPYYQILNTLPFKYMISEPVRALQGNLVGIDLFYSLLTGLGWIVILYLLVLFVWNRGLKIYNAVGQ